MGGGLRIGLTARLWLRHIQLAGSRRVRLPALDRRDCERLELAVALERAHKLAKARPMFRSAVRPLLTGKVEDWHGEYAYSLGLQAFIYGFPYIYNAQLRHK